MSCYSCKSTIFQDPLYCANCEAFLCENCTQEDSEEIFTWEPVTGSILDMMSEDEARNCIGLEDELQRECDGNFYCPECSHTTD